MNNEGPKTVATIQGLDSSAKLIGHGRARLVEIPVLRKSLGITLAMIVGLVLLVQSDPVWGLRGSPVVMEDVGINKPGVWSLQGNMRFESGRQLTDQSFEYDNFRVHNLGARWGLTDSLEVGVDFGHTSNSADNMAPDESGMEATNLRVKIPWHEFLSTSVRFGFSGDDVFPYGSDGVDVGVNVPFRFPFARGDFHGELGMTFKSGSVGGGSGTPGGVQWDDYVNYGAGYVFDVHRLASMSVELVGHSPTTSGGSLSYEDHLELDLGGQLHLSPKSRVSPSVGIGLLEGSPDFSLGLGFETKFGNPTKRRDTMESPQPEERYAPTSRSRQMTSRDMSAAGGKKGDRSGAIQARQTPNAPTKRLIRQGREAFDRGNLHKAINKFKEAEQYDPSNLIIQSNLGSLYFRTRKYRKARDHYKQALEIEPEDAFSHTYLGLTYYRLGNVRMARRHLERARQLDPDNDRAKRWLERINNQ